MSNDDAKDKNKIVIIRRNKNIITKWEGERRDDVEFKASPKILKKTTLVIHNEDDDDFSFALSAGFKDSDLKKRLYLSLSKNSYLRVAKLFSSAPFKDHQDYTVCLNVNNNPKHKCPENDGPGSPDRTLSLDIESHAPLDEDGDD